MAFVGEIRDRLNLGKPTELLAEERARLLPLPPTRVPEYSVYLPIVRAWSTIHFAKRVYSVPSRLIGCEVEVRQYPDVVEVWYRGKRTETMPRLRPAHASGRSCASNAMAKIGRNEGSRCAASRPSLCARVSCCA